MKTKRSSGAFWLKNYIAWIVYGLGTLVVLLMQMAPRFFPAIFGARPLPLVLFVVCVAMFGGARVGAVIGVLAGLLWDVYAFRLYGFDALILLVIGLTVGLLVEWYLRANFFSAMLLCAGAALFQMLADWFFTRVIFQDGQWLSLLTKVYIPNALYTILLAPLIYGAVLVMARFVRRRTNG